MWTQTRLKSAHRCENIKSKFKTDNFFKNYNIIGFKPLTSRSTNMIESIFLNYCQIQKHQRSLKSIKKLKLSSKKIFGIIIPKKFQIYQKLTKNVEQKKRKICRILWIGLQKKEENYRGAVHIKIITFFSFPLQS